MGHWLKDNSIKSHNIVLETWGVDMCVHTFVCPCAYMHTPVCSFAICEFSLEKRTVWQRPQDDITLPDFWQ